VYLHCAIALWGEPAAVELYRATLAELDRLIDAAPEVVRRSGSLRLAGLPGHPRDRAEAAETAAELADCADHAAALRARGISVEEYDGELGRGLFFPDDAATNPALRALRLAAGLAGRAALHEHTPVLDVRPGRVTTARGVISAGVVVVAVDGGLEHVLPQTGGRVRAARLQMLATLPADAGRLPCPVYGRWGYDYAQQGSDGRLYVGGGRDRFVEQEWTADPHANAARAGLDRGCRRPDGWRSHRRDPRLGRHRGIHGRQPPAVHRSTATRRCLRGLQRHRQPRRPGRRAVALALDGTTPPEYFAR
jgi:hypothetical protein